MASPLLFPCQQERRFVPLAITAKESKHLSLLVGLRTQRACRRWQKRLHVAVSRSVYATV